MHCSVLVVFSSQVSVGVLDLRSSGDVDRGSMKAQPTPSSK